MSNKGLVSIVVPIYNGEKYIEETVLSVLNQEYQNFDLLCFIDGTKDGTADILRKYEDRLTIIEQENMGASNTRNRGIMMAKGEYVLLLDQDDVLEPTFLSKTVKEIVSSQSWAVAVNGNLIDSGSNKIRGMYRFNKPTLKFKDLCYRNQLYATSQVLFNRQKIAELGGYDSKRAGIADDWDLSIRILQAGGSMVFLDECLMSYRLHDSNNSKNLPRMLTSELNVIEQTIGDVSFAKAIKSYRHMNFSFRMAQSSQDMTTSRESLAQALKLNSKLLFNPRYYYCFIYIYLKGFSVLKVSK
jgi:teichuronic acid biosynthesis glycosyltransferase TuaG